MTDVSAEKNGAVVVSASCHDAEHPSSFIIDGNDRSFWTTTGLYPQEFVIQLSESNVQITRMKTLTTNVRRIVVERSEAVAATNLEKVYETEIPYADGHLQVESGQFQRVSASYLKFKIMSGWDDFATVHKVSVEAK